MVTFLTLEENTLHVQILTNLLKMYFNLKHSLISRGQSMYYYK